MNDQEIGVNAACVMAESPPGQPVIRLDDVHFAYGRNRVLDGVSFSIPGGAVGLLGPNGAGKSTILKTLLGYLKAKSGRVEVMGLSMPRDTLKVRFLLGYMPEREVQSPRTSAVTFLTYCGRLYGMSREDAMERAHEVLNYVGLGEARYRKMETFSTGMLQRVKFGQALIHDPRILLLDEPTNGLDPEGRFEMLDLIKELATRRQVTVLLSSHLLPDIEYVCNRVVMIGRGKVLCQGEIEELTAAREGLFELRVRDRKDEFTAALAELGCTFSDHSSGVLHVRKPEHVPLGRFFEVARARGTQLRHLQPVRRSLEEIFVNAMEGN